MDRKTYSQYLSAFNSRDYDQICTFYTPTVSIHMLGYVIRGPQGVKDFYRFFHSQMDESIEIRAYCSDTDNIFIEAPTTVTALRDLRKEDFDVAGYSRFFQESRKGESTTILNIIQYKLKDGKFDEVFIATRVPDIE